MTSVSKGLQGRFMRPSRQVGATLVELLIALMLAALLFAGLTGVISQTLAIQDSVSARNDLNTQARFAMASMVTAVERSPRLLLPLNDNPATNWPEQIREQTIPPSPPIGDSTLASAVLAVTLDQTLDLDANGTPDADNDSDGRFDEDLGGDATNDNAPGLYLIDDDGDGVTDEGGAGDDDEDENLDDDPLNGLDDDGDGTVDEDAAVNQNADGCPGLCGVDDDADGSIDEQSGADDDEDGTINEDGYEPVVFFLAGTDLIKRTPVPWDESGDGGVTSLDFIEEPIAENVSRFRVERVPQNDNRSQLIDLTLELTSPVSGETVSLNTRVRVGGRL